MKNESENVIACPLSDFVNKLAGKWTIPILYRLISEAGPIRFRELQRRTQIITQKELTKHLRLLEARGLVTRKVFPVIPPKVEYEATPVARELLESLEGIAQWMKKNGKMLSGQKTESEHSKVSSDI
jgi:DNA-binding HxlR family transcriptional regulator